MDFNSSGVFKQEIYSSGYNQLGSLPFSGQASVAAGDRITLIAYAMGATSYDCSLTVTSGAYTTVTYDVSN